MKGREGVLKEWAVLKVKKEKNPTGDAESSLRNERLQPTERWTGMALNLWRLVHSDYETLDRCIIRKLRNFFGNSVLL